MSSTTPRRARLRPGHSGLGIQLAGAALVSCVVAAFAATRPTEPGWPYAFLWLLLSVGACRLLLERFIVQRGALTVTTSWTHEPLSKWSASRVRYTFRDGAGIARGASLVVGTSRVIDAAAELVVAYVPQQPWLSTVVEFSRYEVV